MTNKFKIFAIIFSFAIVYLMVSFVKLQLNFFCWSEGTRITFIVFSLFISLVFLLIEETSEVIGNKTKNNLNK